MASNSTSLSDFAHSIFSYNTNIMLAALISLLLVVLFVLLLHAYANCFFPHLRHRLPRRHTVTTVTYLLAPPRLSPFDSLPFDLGSKGLDPSLISAIPLFVYESEEEKCAKEMECVICLCEFQDREIGRRLPKCGHGFHLDCIDMWLNSHANCPVCRAPVVGEAADCSDAAESDRFSGEREIGGEMVMEERNNCEIQRNEEQNGEIYSSDSASPSSSTDPPLMSLVASLKRMMSRNRSEGRIFPTSNGVELDV